MKQTTYKPTVRPSVRKPRSARGSLLPMRAPFIKWASCARAWLRDNVGLTCIAAGWVVVLAVLVVPKTGDFAGTIVELGVLGAALFGFGIGWIVRADGDER